MHPNHQGTRAHRWTDAETNLLLECEQTLKRIARHSGGPFADDAARNVLTSIADLIRRKGPTITHCFTYCQTSFDRALTRMSRREKREDKIKRRPQADYEIDSSVSAVRSRIDELMEDILTCCETQFDCDVIELLSAGETLDTVAKHLGATVHAVRAAQGRVYGRYQERLKHD